MDKIMSLKVHVLMTAVILGNAFGQAVKFPKSEVDLKFLVDSNEQSQVGNDPATAAKDFIAIHNHHQFSSEFISTLYHNLSKGMNLATTSSGDPMYGVTYSKANTVRALPTSGCRSGQRRHKQLVFTFNVSVAEENLETIHGVQLRVKTDGLMRSRSRTFIAATMIDGSVKSFVSSVQLLAMKLQPDKSWIVDVTRIYIQWHNFIKTQNLHHQIPFFSIVLVEFGGRKPMTRSKIAKSIRRLGSTKSKEQTTCTDVILVMYTEAEESTQWSLSPSPSPETLATKRLNRRHIDQSLNTGHCRRVPMNIEFSQLGLGQWVIYPNKFNSYQCTGLCSGYLVDSYSKPTNHALVQSLMRLMTGNPEIPDPCCIPTKLSPISVLYFEKGNTVIKYLEDMVIEECSCA